MATDVAIAKRRTAALQRIGETLGVDTYVQGRHAAMNEVRLLERIADAVEKASPDKDVALQAAIDRADHDTLTGLVGVGSATADRMMEGRDERLAGDIEAGDGE